MQTFSLNSRKQVDHAYYKKVQSGLDAIRSWLQHIVGEDWYTMEYELQQKALEKRDDAYTDIVPYLKKLAINMHRANNTSKGICSVTTLEAEDADGMDYQYMIESQEGAKVLEYTNKGIIIDALQDIYLRDEKVLDVLQEIYYNALGWGQHISDIRQYSQSRKGVLNANTTKALQTLMRQTNSEVMTEAVQDFIIMHKRGCKKATTQKEMLALPLDVQLIYNTLPKENTVEIDNKAYSIDLRNMKMNSPYDIDMKKFKVIIECKHHILKIDISPILYWVESKLQAEEGVNTQVITWAGSKYRLKTPAGDNYYNMDLELFLTQVRSEIISTFIRYNIMPIALSEDSVYCYTNTKLFSSIHYGTAYQGKHFVLLVEKYCR